MKYKTVIWDFNGTLFDDMGVSIDAMNTVLSRRSLPLINGLFEFQNVFGFPVRDYYSRIGLDFSKEPYEVPADEWIELYGEKMNEAPIMKDADTVLKRLHDMGIRQIVLSASEKGRLIENLEHLGIISYFDEILGMDNAYAKGKAEIAKEFAARDKEGIFPAILIGDTDHDFQCAESIGCDCILYSGGFMSRSRLEKLGAPVIDSLSEIFDYLI
jgi:phosphoglycolate phosphatase